MGRLMSVLVFFALTSTQSKAVIPKVIYGEDNRVDVYETTNSLYQELARSTAAMISTRDVVENDDQGTFEIKGETLTEMGICSEERFSKQLTAARCSGFLVGPDLLVTAGHCMRTAYDCKNSVWVFDYKMDNEETTFDQVPADNVYHCQEIIQQVLDPSTENDFALIRLQKEVKDRRPLDFRKVDKIEDHAPLVVIGHPTGLPTKIADGAQVRTNDNSIFFVANLDTYGGNSGSAVFHAETGLVEGILVRGENDYNYGGRFGSCRTSNMCTEDGCRGEDVTRITNISDLLLQHIKE